MIPDRAELVRRVRAAWPAYAAQHGRPGGVPPVREGGNTAALIDLAVDLVLDAVEGGAEPHEHPFPGNVLEHVQGMDEGESDEDSPEQARGELHVPTESLDHAMILTSLTGRTTHTRWDVNGWHDLGAPLHRPVLDVDLPVRVLPSSTPGHHHLLIDRLMTWDQYVALLDALVEAGIVEPGYVSASKERGHTGVRVPWWPKGDPPPELPPGAPVQCPICRVAVPADQVESTWGVCAPCFATEGPFDENPFGPAVAS